MNEWSRPDYAEGRNASVDLVEAVVRQALSRVVSRSRDDATQDYGHSVEALAQSVLSVDPDDRHKLIATLIKHGVTVEDLSSDYAPDAARHLGALWEQSEISFVDVTIGVARLQETIRILSSRRVRTEGTSDRPRVFLIVPTEEDHVYSGLTASLAFEKLGCDTTLAIGHSQAELIDRCIRTRHDMIGLSVSSRRNVRVARSLIQALRKAIKVNIPVAIGGGLVNASDLDLCALTGANCATSDPRAALSSCGIRLPSNAYSIDGPTNEREVLRG